MKADVFGYKMVLVLHCKNFLVKSYANANTSP